MCVHVLSLFSFTHCLQNTLFFFPLLPIFVVLLPQVSTNFFSSFRITFFSCFTQYYQHFSSFPGFIDFSELRFPHILLCIFFFFFEEGGYCSDLHLTHTLTHLYILHYNLVPVFSPNSPTHFSFSLVSHPFLLSFSYWFLWPRGNQQTCALCVKMCSPGFVLVWSDLVLQQMVLPQLTNHGCRCKCIERHREGITLRRSFLRQHLSSTRDEKSCRGSVVVFVVCRSRNLSTREMQGIVGQASDFVEVVSKID